VASTPPHNRNGNGVLTYKWLAGIVIGLVLIGLGLLTREQQSAEQIQSQQIAQALSIQAARGERIATLETKIANSEAAMAALRTDLALLSSRVDRLSEQGRQRP